MSLPPGFVDELRGRLSLGQVVGRKVMWDPRKSNQGKGDLWAPCPFHQEKTASFHVDDRKGYYYCFGCHAKGDAISFVRETENVGFVEAVEILAREAGMQMPAPDPQAKAAADKRGALAEVMEEAVRFFRLQLRSAAAAEARAYLDRRGVGEAQRERWEIGFAPAGWEQLRDTLTGRGVALQALLDCGLVRPSDKGRAPYDVFRNRIMFPIRDARGRAIAFGGRAMDPGESAKYLNSPQTALFDKSRTLYNHGPARSAAGRGQPVIVAEGYMDVIALVEAGFEAAVAPLGTAITEEHLALIWRMSPEPVITLDGDAAGQGAAGRLVDLALPRLSGMNTLYFARLPAGQDPDDLIRAQGRKAIEAVLEAKLPLVRVLWERELKAGSTATPEQKAGLDKRVRALVQKIADPDVRRYYAEALKQFRWETFRPANWAPEFRRRTTAARVSETARASLLARSLGTDEVNLLQERIVAGIAIRNVEVAMSFRDGLERFEIEDRAAAAVLGEILGWQSGADPDEAVRRLEAALGSAQVRTILDDGYVRLQPAVRRDLPAEAVLHEFASLIARVSADRGQRREIAYAELEYDGVADERLTWRLAQAAESTRLAGADPTDRTEFETGPNGAKVRRDERDAFEALLGQIDYAKGIVRR